MAKNVQDHNKKFRFLTRDFSYPLPGETVDVFHSGASSETFSLSAHGGVGTSIETLLVKAFNAPISDPLNTAGTVEAKIDNGVFCVPDLLVAGLDPLITNVMSVRAWNADDLTETFAANNLPVNFTDEVTVFAKQCIWAHYAYSGLTGPDVLVNGVNINNPRENAWYFRPTVVPVPADLGITKVSLSCPTPADWHNIDASNQYGPNGIHPAQPVSVRNEYLQHPQFNFPNTTQHSQKVNLGKLIAMLIGETATGSNIAGPIVEVGEGPVSVADLTIDGGVRASKILLGFHDKQEWYDNGGYQTVQVQFS